MSDFETLEDTTPLAHATIAYLGPVAPHWEIRGHFGDTKMIDAFWTRVTARLLLLPRHDPQFRRNKERVNRDAERERITLDWDLGDDEPSRTPAAQTVAAPAAPVVQEPVVEEPAAEEPLVDESSVEDAVEDAPVEEVAVASDEAEAPSESESE